MASYYKTLYYSVEEPQQVAEGTVQTIVSQAIELLGGEVSAEMLSIVGSTMDNNVTRGYHAVGHHGNMTEMNNFELEAFMKHAHITETRASEVRAIVTSSGFFHDSVYTQVDGGILHPFIKQIVGEYCDSVQGDLQWKLKDNSPQNSLSINAIMQIYEISPGQTLTYNPPQQNEFLSTLLEATILEREATKPVPLRSIVRTGAVTYGTIPFKDHGNFDKLYDRLSQVNEKLNLGLTAQQINETVKMAVYSANKDVFGFAGNGKDNMLDRFQQYIRGTWRLMPETNPALRTDQVTASTFRATLAGNLFFVDKILKRDNIFHQRDGYPSNEDLAQLNEFTGQNLTAAEHYFKTKIAAVALVEAIADQRGLVYNEEKADITLKNFLGSSEEVEKKLNGGSIQVERPADIDKDDMRQVVLETLRDRGEVPPKSFDTRKSPIGYFLLKNTDFDKVEQLFKAVNETMGAKHTTAAERKEAAKNFILKAKEIIGDKLVTQITKAIYGANDVTVQAQRKGHGHD